jgi:hypothetical protein
LQGTSKQEVRTRKQSSSVEAYTMELLMKRTFYLTLLAVGAATLSMPTAQAQSQSLGDYARAVKKTKPATVKSAKTYDNDNLPNSSKLSVVGAAQTASAADQKADKNTNQDKDSAAKNPNENANGQKKGANSSEMKAGQSSEERQKAIAAWKQKIDDQKGKVDLLSREIDVLQRERQIKQADFYSSTARAVQNARGFDQEDAKYKQQIADKQKTLDDAKARLNDLQEQARKDGAPNSVAE